MHPQLLQSGAPPNWQGVIRVVKSAEIEVVVRAKTHSSGDDGRVGVDVDQALRRLELLIAQAQRHQVAHHLPPIGWRQAFGGDLADLRRIEADPDLPNLWTLGPEAQELLEVARPGDLLARDRAVHGDPQTGDVLEDAVVGGRRAARVVLGLEPVDRHDDRRARQRRERLRDLADGARDELRVNAARRKARE